MKCPGNFWGSFFSDAFWNIPRSFREISSKHQDCSCFVVFSLLFSRFFKYLFLGFARVGFNINGRYTQICGEVSLALENIAGEEWAEGQKYCFEGLLGWRKTVLLMHRDGEIRFCMSWISHL